MKLIIKPLAILIALFGILIIINPETFFGWIENNRTNTMFYYSVIAGRLVFGILFIIAAKYSKYPNLIKFLGYVAIIAAIIFIFIGHNGFQDFLSSMIPSAKPFGPGVGLFGIALGSFLIYAFSSNKEIEKELI